MIDKEVIQDITQLSLDNLFLRKCIDGKNEDVKYLLTSHELSLKPDIYTNESHAFKAIVSYKNWDLIQFFIINQNFQLSRHTTVWLHSGVVSDEAKEFVRQLLEKRLLKSQLEKDIFKESVSLSNPKYKI